jgi:DNA-binding LacI/PurR family transcriptional regulator
MGEMLRQHQIPFVSVNKHFENKNHIPAYYSEGSEPDMVDFAYKRGHRKIGFVCDGRYPDMKQVARHIEARGLTDCEVIALSINVPSDLDCAQRIMEEYFQLPANKRPTLIAGNYQSCGALLKEISKCGLSCPKDISLISSCESELCRVVSPGLTVISADNRKIGDNATRKLVDFLEKNYPLGYEPCRFKNIVVERESVRTFNESDRPK